MYWNLINDAILIAGVVIMILIFALFVVDSIVWLVIKPILGRIGKDKDKHK